MGRGQHCGRGGRQGEGGWWKTGRMVEDTGGGAWERGGGWVKKGDAEE